MLNRKTLLTVAVLLLISGNLFFGWRYFSMKKELYNEQLRVKTQTMNEKILDFNKYFIDKVLKAEGEIDFETRLKLETAVRNLNDNDILALWQKFVESKDEISAQKLKDIQADNYRGVGPAPAMPGEAAVDETLMTESDRA